MSSNLVVTPPVAAYHIFYLLLLHSNRLNLSGSHSSRVGGCPGDVSSRSRNVSLHARDVLKHLRHVHNHFQDIQTQCEYVYHLFYFCNSPPMASAAGLAKSLLEFVLTCAYSCPWGNGENPFMTTWVEFICHRIWLYPLA